MQQTKYYRKHIFCIEGYWEHDRKKKTSVEKALEFLELNSNFKKTCLHSSTREELKEHIKEFKLKRSDEYSILYFAFHGSSNSLHIGKRQKINLQDSAKENLADIINGAAAGKIIHFGSCSTLAMDRKEITKFRKDTGAVAISGYNKDIPFIESTFLDMLFFDLCQEFKAPSAIDNHMKKNYRGLINRTGFKIYYEPIKRRKTV